MSTPTIETTTQGALSIDMIDPARSQLIWEGTATNRVTESMQRNQAESVQRFVKEIFAQFP
jgi:tRNA A37 threonylcarbamoyladenosine modification protein TsaB